MNFVAFRGPWLGGQQSLELRATVLSRYLSIQAQLPPQRPRFPSEKQSHMRDGQSERPLPVK
ncbi:unnamed protein product [Rangifer tarandus platyrhynchus]|uniref:Uncharacterized protein n=1 Tax=Rangifer tarandus platyrhynchus TaxID=3082113 RepID=A0AC59YEL8_RANTA